MDGDTDHLFPAEMGPQCQTGYTVVLWAQTWCNKSRSPIHDQYTNTCIVQWKESKLESLSLDNKNTTKSVYAQTLKNKTKRKIRLL